MKYRAMATGFDEARQKTGPSGTGIDDHAPRAAEIAVQDLMKRMPEPDVWASIEVVITKYGDSLKHTIAQ